MRVVKIVYDGVVRTLELPAQIVPRGYIIGKPLHVFIDGIENAVINGIYPIDKPVALGSTGVIRVLEAPSANEGLSGKVAFVSPVSYKGLLSVDLDGLLSTYVVVPEEHIIGVTNTVPRPLSALSCIASLSYRLALEAGPNPLIVGCGVSGLMTALHVLSDGGSPEIICVRRESLRYARSVGLVPIQSLENLKEEYSSVVYTSNAPWMLRSLLRRGISKLVVSPLINRVSIMLMHSIRRVEVIMPMPSRIEYKREVVEKIRRLLGFVELNNIVDVFGLVPPPKPGVIISFTRS